jgi:D-serine deaminase-like pyridoxal phosphate-dependent protein
MWDRLRRAIENQPLPCALVDLDAFDQNLEQLKARAKGKPLRIASKSIRCPQLIDRAVRSAIGLMTFSAAESEFLVERGARDLILAYPTAQASDAAILARLNQKSRCAVVVDDRDQLAPLAKAANDAGASIPVIIELDVSYKPLGMHIGVRRSPLREIDQIVELARTIASTKGLIFDGIMGYEAQIAGLPDNNPFGAWQNPVKRLLRKGSRADVMQVRQNLVQALQNAGLPPRIVNGGGTGSVDWSSAESALTEVTVGSGFLAGHLFDYYADFRLQPSLYFALQVVRRPAKNLVTCHLGGYVASGQIGSDRLPLPSLPPGCKLLPMEGAGEVQTPVQLPDGVELPLGAPIFFRHAKSGELAERFNEYLLISGDRIVDRAPTYRGMGQAFG